jgi:hypothetical protein
LELKFKIYNSTTSCFSKAPSNSSKSSSNKICQIRKGFTAYPKIIGPIFAHKNYLQAITKCNLSSKILQKLNMYISKLLIKSLRIRDYKVENVWVFWVKQIYNLCLSLKNLAKTN